MDRPKIAGLHFSDFTAGERRTTDGVHRRAECRQSGRFKVPIEVGNTTSLDMQGYR